MDGSDKVKEKMDNIFTPETCPRSSFRGNDERNSRFFKGIERGSAPFLQDAERNEAYFGKFNPGYFMAKIPTPHQPHLFS